MRCVYDALPPRARLRWLLMTVRLSTSSLAGTARTLVAVGTARLASMFVTTRDAAPRSGRRSPPVVDGAAAAFGSGAGFSCAFGAGAGFSAGATGAGGGWLAAGGAVFVVLGAPLPD